MSGTGLMGSGRVKVFFTTRMAVNTLENGIRTKSRDMGNMSLKPDQFMSASLLQIE